MPASRRLKTAIVKYQPYSSLDDAQFALINDICYTLDHLDPNDNTIHDLSTDELLDKIIDDLTRSRPGIENKTINDTRALILNAAGHIPPRQRLQLAIAQHHFTFEGINLLFLNQIAIILDKIEAELDSFYKFNATHIFQAATLEFIEQFPKDSTDYIKYAEAKFQVQGVILPSAKAMDALTLTEALALVDATQNKLNQLHEAAAPSSVVTSQHLFGKTGQIKPKSIFTIPANLVNTQQASSNDPLLIAPPSSPRSPRSP
jgi:hypothetical protein